MGTHIAISLDLKSLVALPWRNAILRSSAYMNEANDDTWLHGNDVSENGWVARVL